MTICAYAQIDRERSRAHARARRERERERERERRERGKREEREREREIEYGIAGWCRRSKPATARNTSLRARTHMRANKHHGELRTYQPHEANHKLVQRHPALSALSQDRQARIPGLSQIGLHLSWGSKSVGRCL